MPATVELLWSAFPGDDKLFDLYCVSDSDNTFNEQSIMESHPDFSNPKYSALCITFKENVRNQWKDATARNLNKPIAFVIDNKVYFAPRIQGEIPGGKISLTGGGFSKTMIRKLVAIISGGVVPLKFIVADNR